MTAVADYIVPPVEPIPVAPQGEPDERDRDKWLLLALLTLADLEAAKVFWRAHSPPGFFGLLTGDGGWTFDPQAQQYVNRHGAAMSADMLKGIALLLIASAGEDFQHEASRVATGELTIDEWQRRLADDVKDLILVLIALAVGGFAAVTQADLDLAIGSPDEPGGLAYSISRLQNFANDIASGSMTEDAIIRRAGMYAESGYPIFEQERRQSHIDAVDDKGRAVFLFERNILDDQADHCDECPELTAEGWQPIGTMPPIGTRQCSFRCHCHFEFSLTGPI